VAITLDYHALNPFDADLPRQLQIVREILQARKLHSVIETGARFLLDPWQKHQPTLISPDSEGRRKRLEFLKRAVDIARELRSDAVSFWSGSPVSDEPMEVLQDRLVAGCGELCAHAQERQVRLAFEPEPGMLIDTMARFAAFHELAAHPWLGLTLDIGHLQCLDEVPIGDHFWRWRDLLWNVHIEDMCRGVHDHLMFGEGEIEFGPVMRTLAKIGYTGGVHVELSRHSHDAVNTARQALEFLKSIP
jgi:sugar phosphate isomerase/epimerase